MLQRAALDLQHRLSQAEGLGRAGPQSATATQLRVALAQVTHVMRELVPSMRRVILAQGQEASEIAAQHMVQYLATADRAFRGIGVQPLALNTARMIDRATQGVQSSILHRLSTSGQPEHRVGPGGELEVHPAKVGILQRYGTETIAHFEEILQRGMIARKSFREMRDEITAVSPFLQQAPASWAERIVRTETMGAYGKAAWEATREADEQLGDVVKILAAHFDMRTGADSVAVHGQIRRPDEAFQWWDGMYIHPPNRPNDRETVVSHRISWQIPPYLKWQTPMQIMAAWKRNGRKGPPPARDFQMTTVPLHLFGKPPVRKKKRPPEDEDDERER